MEETQRVCGNCGHQKRGHELPRAEGGAGGGDSGQCLVYSCPCRRFVPTEEFKEQKYSGPADLPKWIKEGAQLKVKATPSARRFGINVGGGQDGYAWPGEVGTVTRHDGVGWWSWSLEFSRGRSCAIRRDELDRFVRVSAKRHRYEGEES